MAFESRYIFSARMDVTPDKEALFNEVYDKEHVPALTAVPGVIAIARFRAEPVTMMIGGEKKTIVIEDEPRYNALYEVESPDVLTSDAWAKAVELGRWAPEVRPFTRNRKHVLYRRIAP
jgi:hypothetical protein